jgi:hypothetical protein
MNETIKTILIALIVVWLYNNYSKEGFSYRRYNVLEGYNNMVLTNPNGDLASIAFPKGMIIIWTGAIADIPKGWAICDGNNGTPNLKGKFLLGANTDPNAAAMFRTPGMGGGSNKISVDQLPAHNHTIRGILDSNGSYNAGGPTGFNTGDRRTDILNTNRLNEQYIGSTGLGQDYYPPFVTVAYIMKL